MGVRELEELRIRLWNETVPEDGLVYYVGDFCDGDGPHGMNGVVQRMGAYRRRLNGRIVLILGNHEREELTEVYKAIFDEVVPSVRLEPQKLILCHEPVLPPPAGYRLIYGHVHAACPEFPDATADTFCCCVQRTGNRPVGLRQALELMDGMRVGEIG